VPLQCDVGKIAPAAVVVVAVGEVDRAKAVRASRVDISAAVEEEIDEADVAGHHRPVNRQTAALVGGFCERGIGLDHGADAIGVARFDGVGDCGALRRHVVTLEQPGLQHGE
jgi:hypothetical protein